MPTARSKSSERSRASRAFTPRWKRIASPSWLSIVNSGFRLVIGS
jgi:hypothetical protein